MLDTTNHSLDRWRPLHFEDRYPCPFCRQGQISHWYLMEVFSCGLCDRIFSADLSQQTIQLENDTEYRKRRWRWSGHRWQRSEKQDTSVWLLLLSLAVVILPTTLIGVAGYLFPPLPQDTIPFPVRWAALTGILHLAVVLWFWLAYYQIPLWVILRVRMRRWMGNSSQYL